MLQRVAGLVEMSVMTLLPGMPPSPRARQGEAAATPGNGTAYLRRAGARIDRERHLRLALDALRARVTSALGALVREESGEVRGSDDALSLSLSYLIDRHDEKEFRLIVERVGRDSAARLVVAGPRAPYSFAPSAGARTSGSSGQDPR